MKISGCSRSIGFSVTLIILAGFLAIPVKGAGLIGPVKTPPSPHVELIELAPLPGDNGSTAAAINDAGEVVGTSGGGGTPHAFMYRSGRINKLSNEPSRAYAINDDGQIVGSVYSTNTIVPLGGGFGLGFGAVLFGPGMTTTFLESPNPSEARGINNQGDIVGNFTFLPHSAQYAFLYQNGVTTFLPDKTNTIPFIQMTANGINNQGDIVGFKTVASGPYFIDSPVLWHQGQMQDLRTLGGTTALATAINDVGDIVGWSTTVSNKEVHAFLYHQGEMIDLGVRPDLGLVSSEAFAINNWSMIVGAARINTSTHAFLYANNTMTDLNKLVRLTRVGRERGFVTLTTATGINDLGQIVGNGVYWDGRQESTRAFLLDLHLFDSPGPPHRL